MLRLIHNQTVQGAILVDDIDDGLPNKAYHRLGSTADPKAYVRDGIIGKPKQPCYVPRTMAAEGFPLVPGYINLNETQRVTLSAGKGKIYGFQQTLPVPLITVLSLTAAQIVAPTLALAKLGVPGVGDLTLTLGTTGTFLSVTPDETTVFITGVGAVTLTATQIVNNAPPGTVLAISIFIPANMVPGIQVANTFVQVLANEQLTVVLAVS
jgi:hypothetical protein